MSQKKEKYNMKTGCNISLGGITRVTRGPGGA